MAPERTEDAAGNTDPDNIAGLVSRAAARDGSRVALIDGDRRVSWAELDHRVTDLAGGLLGLGLHSGDRLAISLGNTVDFALSYFAALRAGLVVVPANTGLTEPELRHLLGDSGAAGLVTDAPTAARTGAGGSAPAHLVVAGDGALPAGAHLLADLSADLGPAAPGGEDLAVLLYTSGTSGTPKGAMLTHRALLANLAQVIAIDPAPMTGTDVALLVLPFFHIYGLNTGLGMVAWTGGTGVLVDRFDPEDCVRLMAAERVTVVAGAPPMFVAWSSLPDSAELRRGFADVRVAMSGAAPLPAPVLAAMQARAGVAVFEGYGLTETAPVLTSTLMGGVAKPSSVGRPVPGVQLVLRGADGQPLQDESVLESVLAESLQDEAVWEGSEDTGQITVRGANLFSGYWPDGHGGPDEAGWLATGDIGYLDDDGDLHLVDRITDLILVSGFNVYPAEVERVLAAHPGVIEAAVIARPDGGTGAAVHALVVPRSGVEATAGPTTAELIAYCAGRLARFKCPRTIEFVPELPHSVTGKVSRARLRAASRSHGAGQP